MKKIVLTLSILLSMMVYGCSESTKISTPPWSDSQVQMMENNDTNVVPFVILQY